MESKNTITSKDIRRMYLETFEDIGHVRRPSSTLVPDDGHLMFTNSGMYQFKDYFTRDKLLREGDGRGFTTCQKCVRTGDLDQVGHDGRHLTFFEMLGNFSFGTVTPEEMCSTSLSFCTEKLGLDPDRLYFTVHENDDRTHGIWLGLGVDPDHVSRLGDDDNFWSVGDTGPCGPCTEIYYDQGEDVGCGNPECKPGCDCDRFLEFWNIVFTRYDRQDDDTLIELPGGGNIDTGMGLERVCGILQGTGDNYGTDVLWPIVGKCCDLSGKVFGEDGGDDVGIRIVSDHVRTGTFLIVDGVMPSNNGRGYVLRKILRRMFKESLELGIGLVGILDLVGVVGDVMGNQYPEVVTSQPMVLGIISGEWERFVKTLDRGCRLLERIGNDEIDGHRLFWLYDTHGIPVDVTWGICNEMGIRIVDGSMETFEKLMDRQRGHGGKVNSW